MKHLILTTVAAVVLVGCGESKPPVSIHDAAEKGNIAAVKQYLADGTDVNTKDSRGETPLHLAAAKGHKEVTELLITEGADVNAKSDTEFEGTPLDDAADGGHKEVVELLIAKGADVNAKRDDGETPLDWASTGYENEPPEDKIARKEIADLLRKHGGKTGEELKAEGK